MANYNSYPDIGIDAKIKIAQNVLSSKLQFTNVDFYGRAQRTVNKDLKTNVPECFMDFPKRREVYYDGKNAPGGNVFFIDDISAEEVSGQQFKTNVKVVFMLNLDKVFAPKQYRADTEVQSECIKLLKSIGFFNGKITISKGVDEVFKGFDTSNIKLKNIQPFHVFSVNGSVNYSLNNSNC